MTLPRAMAATYEIAAGTRYGKGITISMSARYSVMALCREAARVGVGVSKLSPSTIRGYLVDINL